LQEIAAEDLSLETDLIGDHEHGASVTGSRRQLMAMACIGFQWLEARPLTKL
jgi:hypothetical protein